MTALTGTIFRIPQCTRRSGLEPCCGRVKECLLGCSLPPRLIPPLSVPHFPSILISLLCVYVFRAARLVPVCLGLEALCPRSSRAVRGLAVACRRARLLWSNRLLGKGAFFYREAYISDYFERLPQCQQVKAILLVTFSPAEHDHLSIHQRSWQLLFTFLAGCWSWIAGAGRAPQHFRCTAAESQASHPRRLLLPQGNSSSIFLCVFPRGVIFIDLRTPRLSWL